LIATAHSATAVRPRAPWGQRSARRWIWALPIWSLLLALTTLTHQPDPDTDFAAYADYVTTTPFRASHILGSIAGAALGLVGAFALTMLLTGTRGERTALRGVGLFTLGQTLTISVFGAAAFAQPAIGATAHRGDVELAAALDDLVYGPPLFATAAVGLLALIAGTVLLGRAATASRFVAPWAGRTFAAAGVTFYLTGLPGLVLQPIAGVAMATAAIAIARAARPHRRGEDGRASAAVTGVVTATSPQTRSRLADV